jgi:hypothetical protein
MKSSFSICAICCLLLSSLSAQEIKTKFGKIEPADLAMTTYAPDPEANAVVLSKVGYIHFDPTRELHKVITEFHTTIKVLTEEGIDEVGNAIIPYVSYNNNRRIGYLRAQVHLPDGTIVKVDKSDMFDEKSNRYVNTRKIAFPKLVKGAIIEYEYEMLSADVFQPVNWFFQDQIPIRYAELKTYFPEWLEYVVLTQGSSLDVAEHEVMHEPLYNTNYLKSNFINADVPALREECCITTMQDYYARIRFQLKTISPPFQMRREIMNTWENLAKELYDTPEWGGQLLVKRPGQLVLQSAGIAPATGSNQLEVARKIYAYVNENIQWDRTYDYGWNKAINEIVDIKSGSSGEINKILCAALVQAGINAKPVLTSTREYGKMIQLYPFTNQFNHLVVLAMIDNKDVWLDAGVKNLPFGMLREEVLHGHAWVVDEKKPFWKEFTPTPSKSVFLLKGTIDEEGQLTGELECRFTGYHGLEKRAMVQANATNDLNLVSNGAIPLPVESMEVLNKEDEAAPLQIKASILDQPVATVTPDKIYINPLFPTGMDELPFFLEERTYPIEMNYPAEYSMTLSLTLPEGYKAESVTAPVRYSTENNGIQMLYESSELGNKLNITMKFSVLQMEFPAEEYQAVKNMYAMRKEKFTSQVILTKS